MLAGGTGITPIYQILQAAAINKDTFPEFTLIFGNKTTNDIFMREEIDEVIKTAACEFTMHYLIDKEEPGWTGLVGYVSKDMISKYFPAPSDDTLMLICGPPVMCEKAKGFFAELGYNKDNIFEF
jgi:cytochrome-b5 reductase